jgi:hypothetical protein
VLCCQGFAACLLLSNAPAETDTKANMIKANVAAPAVLLCMLASSVSCCGGGQGCLQTCTDTNLI